MIRREKAVLAEGTFQVILTPQQRIVTVLDAPSTLLGPLHIVLEVRRHRPPEIHLRASMRRQVPPPLAVGSIFSDIGDAISSAAEGAFHTVSKAVTSVARPVFNLARDAASEVTHGLASLTPFLPSQVRNDIHAAARVVARARLGDLTAKQFIRGIASAAKAGIEGARRVGDALLDGTKLVAHAIDLPARLLGNVPILGGVINTVSPFQKFEHLATTIQKGDLEGLKNIVKGDLSIAQGVLSFVPGVGTGISAGISAGLAALEGGSPIEIAIHAAYGAIPIPPGVRSITDGVLSAILELVHSGNITDAVLKGARERVPSGFPRDVFDTLAQILIKGKTVTQAAGDTLAHYVERYAGNAGKALLAPVESALSSSVDKLTASPLMASLRSELRPRFLPMHVAGDDAPSVPSLDADLRTLVPHESVWRTLRAVSP